MATTTTTTAIDSDYKARASISSSTTTLYTLNTNSDPSFTFTPTRILHIDSRGIGAFRLPIPSREKEITISNSDGSQAYTSIRDKLWSGNSLLSHAKRGDLIRTDYFFGPSREPILHLLQAGTQTSNVPSEIHVTGQWTSRTTRFVMPSGREYEWFYAKEKSNGQRTNLLVLRSVSKAEGNNKDVVEHRRIAQLVRGAETRTPGTTRCTAGNGGELQLDEKMIEGELEFELDTSVVVATCLMMLKKEIDRRRLIQMCVIGGAAGS